MRRSIGDCQLEDERLGRFSLTNGTKRLHNFISREHPN